MKYRLLKDETVILKAVPHKYAVIPDIILSAVIIAVSFVLKYGVWGIVAAAILLGAKLFCIFGNGITITNRNFILKKRTLKSYGFSIPLSDIENIQIERGLFGKIFGYGTVIVVLKYKIFAVKSNNLKKRLIFSDKSL